MLLISNIILLLVNAVTLRRDTSILFNRVAILILLYSGILGYDSLYITSLETGIGIYGGLFHSTSITHNFELFIYIIGAIILQLTAFYPRRLARLGIAATGEVILSSSQKKYAEFELYRKILINKMGEQFTIIEYPLIILFILIGATFLMSSSDLVSMFIAIELQSYGLYILATIYRNSELSTSAGLTYFLLGGLSSCFILLGSSLLYVNSGLTSLDGIFVLASLSEKCIPEAIIISDDLANPSLTAISETDYFNLALLIMSIGFLFKVSAAPFHFWSPDVYDALGTTVTVFVAIIPKISLFIFLLELVHYAGLSMFEEFSWTNVLLISSLLSLIVGTVVGLVQHRIKRLLAYSSISHVGFLLLALAINSTESTQAFLFYLMQYSISNLNIFFIIILMGYSLIYVHSNSNKLIDYKNSPLQHIPQMKGYFYINSFLALSFSVCIFSLIGIPPFLGFFGKLMVLSAALQKGYIFLALVGILTSVIGAVYYLGIVKTMFFDKSDYTINKKSYVTYFSSCSSSLTITISVLTLMISLFILSPSEWLSMANILALILFNP